MTPFANFVQLPGAQALPAGIKAVRGGDHVDASTPTGADHGVGEGGPGAFMAWLHQLMNRCHQGGGPDALRR